MARAKHNPLLNLIHKVKLIRGSAHFSFPLLADGALYVGQVDQDLIKLNGESLRVLWRRPSAGFVPRCASSNLVILTSDRSFQTRAVDADGTIVWTLEPKGRWGWDLWRDRLLSFDLSDGVTVVDPATGLEVDRIPLETRPGEVAWFRCGDILLLCQGKGDPFRAYDLTRHEFIWERNLLQELARQYRVENNSALLRLRAGQPGRFIGARGKGLFAFDLTNGQLVWGVPVHAKEGPLNVDGDRIYVWARTDDIRSDRLVCLDETTGSTVYEVPVEPYGPWSEGALSARHLAYAARMGVILLFRRSDGEEVWRHDYKQGTSDAPLIAGNRMFVCGGDGNLLVFEGDI